MPYVTLTRVKNLRRAGVLTSHYPGDTVKVGRQTALEWILDGSALDPFGQVGPPVVSGPRSDKFGIRIRGRKSDVSLAPLGQLGGSLTISYGPPAITCQHTAIWNPKRVISENLVNYGFHRILLEEGAVVAWEMAAGIVSLDRLAKDIGSPEEQEKTKNVVGDLRLPVYDPRLIWVRKCERAEEMISLWVEDLKTGGDEYHAFLRALYVSRVMLCTLPADWSTR